MGGGGGGSDSIFVPFKEIRFSGRRFFLVYDFSATLDEADDVRYPILSTSWRFSNTRFGKNADDYDVVWLMDELIKSHPNSTEYGYVNDTTATTTTAAATAIVYPECCSYDFAKELDRCYAGILSSRVLPPRVLKDFIRRYGTDRTWLLNDDYYNLLEVWVRRISKSTFRLYVPIPLLDETMNRDFTLYEQYNRDEDGIIKKKGYLAVSGDRKLFVPLSNLDRCRESRLLIVCNPQHATYTDSTLLTSSAVFL